LDSRAAAASFTTRSQSISTSTARYWNGALVDSFSTLEHYLRTTANQTTQPKVHINANRHARYDTVAKVLAAAQRNGIQRLGFVEQERFAQRQPDDRSELFVCTAMNSATDLSLRKIFGDSR